VAAITEPIPSGVPTTQPAQIRGELTLVGFNTKRKLKNRQEESEDRKRSVVRRRLQVELARRYLEKRQSGCTFYITVNNITVYTIDLDTLSQGQTIPFDSNTFIPSANSSSAYVEQCPPGTENFPELNVANLTLLTGPAAPAELSVILAILLTKALSLISS
jgi:hypothetical protein